MSIYLSANDVHAAMSMNAAVDAVRDSFIGLARGDFELPLRLSLGDGRFLVMSAHHPSSGTAIVKTLSLNFDRLPAICGTVVWSELQSERTLVFDASAMTAVRTGAASGVATDLLAPRTAERLVVIGAGAQSLYQVRGVAAVRALRSVCLVDRDLAKAQELAERVRAEYPDVDVDVDGESNRAVRDADIICTVTNSKEPVFDASFLPARVHVNAIGAFQPSMRELPSELLATADVVVDQIEAATEESGEIIHALATKAITEDSLIELGALLQDPHELGPRTVFKSVGLATQDWATARMLADMQHASHDEYAGA